MKESCGKKQREKTVGGSLTKPTLKHILPHTSQMILLIALIQASGASFVCLWTTSATVFAACECSSLLPHLAATVSGSCKYLYGAPSHSNCACHRGTPS